MVTSKKANLKSLLESIEGIHLTAYLVNTNDLDSLKAQLRDVIQQAHEWLSPVMTTEEKGKFLEPLNSLLLDARILKQMSGNIGLFRNRDSFRVLNLPIDVELTCQVATSFHVKPILRWLQKDQDFLLLGLTRKSAHLYFGNQSSFKYVDSIFFSDLSIHEESPGTHLRYRINEQDSSFEWMNDWLSALTKFSKPRLFVAGEKSLLETLTKTLKYQNLVKAPAAHSFDVNAVNDLCVSLRKISKEDSRNRFEKSLREFHFAEEGNRTCKNIFQIAKAIVRGKVRKLIVTDELSIFGKIDKVTGGLAIHPFDLDHEDDDILDDLAQMVLSQGGEVIIASRDEIPKGRPILAILDDTEKDLEKSEDFQPFEAHQ